MHKGTELHAEYSAPYKSWDRRLVRYNLDTKYGPFFKKRIENITVRGVYDDFRVLLDLRNQQKRVSFVELKTTRKGFLFPSEFEAAVFQLQIYVWIMGDLIEPPYVLHDRHYLEIIDQNTNRMIKRVTVRADPDIEDKIKFIARVFQGLEPAPHPPAYVCKNCPRPVVAKCDWYKSRRELLGVEI